MSTAVKRLGNSPWGAHSEVMNRSDTWELGSVLKLSWTVLNGENVFIVLYFKREYFENCFSQPSVSGGPSLRVRL